MKINKRISRDEKQATYVILLLRRKVFLKSGKKFLILKFLVFTDH